MAFKWSEQASSERIEQDSAENYLSASDWSSIEGNTQLPGIFAFGGPLLDTSRNTINIFGGGHQDYHGNDFHSFDIDNETWLRLNRPSLVAQPTGGTLSENENASKSDGTPNTRHAYSGSCYISEDDWYFVSGNATSTSANGHGGVWKFDPNLADRDSITGAWTRLEDSPQGDNWLSAYDAGNNRVIQVSIEGLCVYDVATDTWSEKNTYTSSPFYNRIQGNKLGSAFNPNADEVLVIGDGNAWLWDTSVVSTADRTALTFTGDDTSIIDAKAPGIVWDDVQGVYVAYHPEVSQTSLWLIDEVNETITEWEPDGSNTVTPALTGDEDGNVSGVQGSVYTRFMRDEANNKYYYVPGTSTGKVYTFEDTTGGEGGSTTVTRATKLSLFGTPQGAMTQDNPTTVSPTTVNISLTEGTTDVTYDVTVDCSTVSISTTAGTTDITYGVSVECTVVSIDTAPGTVDVSYDVTVDCTAVSIGITAGTISFANDITVDCTVVGLDVAAGTVTVLVDRTVEAGATINVNPGFTSVTWEGAPVNGSYVTLSILGII